MAAAAAETSDLPCAASNECRVLPVTSLEGPAAIHLGTLGKILAVQSPDQIVGRAAAVTVCREVQRSPLVALAPIR